MDLRTEWSTNQIPGQSRIHREISSQTSATKKPQPNQPNRIRITRQQQYRSKLLWLIWQLKKSNKHLKSPKTQASCFIERFFKPNYLKQEDPPTVWVILSGERPDKRTWEQGVVTHTFNPRDPGAQAGGGGISTALEPTSSSGFLYKLKTISFPGILLAFSTRFGLLRDIQPPGLNNYQILSFSSVRESLSSYPEHSR